ncbi:thioredoxin-disulfide reductase [Actinotignum timonense]|uniref:thioredoxin-disulfide reductase n=1 Tax=Actinotignum TaxID=1653174 RepID=UPI00254E16A9|nr:thioredoxin-disulfide reductase [Actinotignum timonense]MDK6906674.1 thioredoxin-disulfide reductase [Actinotignum timonense]MDY5137803.1 thioredoxin-disulfide reductase [Actinotignum timonense]
MTESDIRDVIIVGSGPAGWTAALYTARAGLKPLVIGGAIDAGGALMTTTEVENYPGFPDGIFGPDLMANMQQQAEKFGAEMEYDDALSMDLSGDVKIVRTDESEFRARTVILALGSAYKKLGLDGETMFASRGVSYCATCDGFFFKDQEIAVVGGGDSAVTDALFLTRFATKVHVIHRRDELRASKIMADRLLADPKIVMHWNSEITDIQGEDGGSMNVLTLHNNVTGEDSNLDVTGLFVAIGHLPRTDILGGQLKLDDGGYIVVNHPHTETSIPGVFACGDVVDRYYRQAISAAGTGCRAALDAERYLENLAAQQAAAGGSVA